MTARGYCARNVIVLLDLMSADEAPTSGRRGSFCITQACVLAFQEARDFASMLKRTVRLSPGSTVVRW